MTYAASTTVSVERSRIEIEHTLQRYGASSFALGYDADKAAIQFAAKGRQVRFMLALPDVGERHFTHSTRGPRTKAAARAQWEQACRQRWRALALCIKAKLEAVESGISSFEDEFLAWTVLPDGSCVADHVGPAIARAYDTGQMPMSLLALPSGADR